MEKLELNLLQKERPASENQDSCGCGNDEPRFAISCGDRSRKAPHWVVGKTVTPSGEAVPRISSRLEFADRLGAFRCRTGAYRFSYMVPAGLYAVGNPGGDSDVLVTGNYKLSFDSLRKELSGRDLWILVLDTKGINVWCAAGKGTFGTEELVRRIRCANLAGVVSHRHIIVPQLGGPGVSAPLVRKQSGFTVRFGPVRASDLPAYLDSEYRADAAMRRIRFTMWDRLILTPMEIRPALKYFPLFAGVVLLVFGLQPSGILFRDAWSGGFPFLVLGLGAVLSGALLTPLILPYIPFPSFAVKGWITGMVLTFSLILGFRDAFRMPGLLILAAGLMFPAMSSYITLQFTGSTTFTGMSGVQRELRTGLPLYALSLAAALVLIFVHRLHSWGGV